MGKGNIPVKRFERLFYILVGAAATGLGAAYLLRRITDLSHLTLFGGVIALLLAGFGLPILVQAIRNSPAARGAFVSLVIVALMFPVAEVALRLADIPKSFSYSEDVTERLEKNIELLDAGERAQPMVPYSLMLQESLKPGVPLFLSGYPDVKTVYCREDEALTVYQADENGFRNQPGMYRGSDTFDAVLLGDSFAHGACVDDGHTIADQLRQITDMSVYNLGYGGTGVAQNIGAYIEYATPKQPKNAVWLLLEGSSISRLLNDERRIPLAAAYTNEQSRQDLPARLQQKRDVLGKIVERETMQLALNAVRGDLGSGGALRAGKGTKFKSLIDPIYGSRIFKLFFNIENALIRSAKPGGKVPVCERLREARPILEEAFRYLQAQSREAGGNLYVGLIPSARFLTTAYPDCEYEMFKELTARLDVPFIDLVAAISAQPEPVSLYAQRARWSSNHFNRKGYKFVAEQIADKLRSTH